MRYLPSIFNTIDNFLKDTRKGITPWNFDSRLDRVYLINSSLPNHFIFLRIEGVESIEKCGFASSVFKNNIKYFDQNYLPIDLPTEFSHKSISAFDVSQLSESPGRVWSVYNDRLDCRFDTPLKGSHQTIMNRCVLASQDFCNLLQKRVFPFLDHEFKLR